MLHMKLLIICVGLMWSHFLIEHDICVTCGWIQKRLGSCEIGLFAQKILTIPSLLVNARERVYTITHKEEEYSLQPCVTSSSQFWFKNLKRNVV